MAKMFYTVEEVAEKLGKTEDEVREMAKSGQIQEFRDRDKLMFKVEQIDLLAGGDDDDDLNIELDSSSSGSGIALADSNPGMSDSREGTGISVFDTDHGDESGEIDTDQTQVGDTLEDDLNLESVGSGSGLLDLTKESDDTAMGAELLEEVYSSDDSNIEVPANASGLFEAAPEQDSGSSGEFASPHGSAMPMVIEAYDGSGSGLGVGMLVGAVVAMICIAVVGIVGVSGVTPQLAMSIASNLWIWFGGLLGITIVLGAVGWFIGRASE